MKKLILGIAAAGALVLLSLALWWFLHFGQPPWAVRLLPPAAVVAYANVAPVRQAIHFEQQFDLESSSGYQQFVRETGIDVRRDLDEMALAAHAAGDNRRYSEVFRGRFDPAKLTAWLERNRESRADYRGFTVYTVRHEGRPVRVALIAADTVAVSNTEAVDSIRAMIDAAKSLFPRGPLAVRQNFREVPAGSLLWIIARFAGGESPSIPLGDGTTLATPLPPDTALVASVRYRNAIAVRVVAITPSEEAAGILLARLQAVLSAARTLASGAQDNADLQKLVQSLDLQQRGRKIEVEAAVPVAMLHTLLGNSKRASPRTPAPR